MDNVTGTMSLFYTDISLNRMDMGLSNIVILTATRDTWSTVEFTIASTATRDTRTDLSLLLPQLLHMIQGLACVYCCLNCYT